MINAEQTRPLFVDIEMLKCYDKPGPRYTSYPTAPRFSGDFGAAEFRGEIVKSNSEDNSSDLSLYFHIPFCDTLCYFCGCTTIITRNRQRIDEYVDYLIKEIHLVAGLLNPQRKVAQLHWGGGTPTYLDPLQIKRLFAAIREHFDFTADAEVSVEIDPRELSEAHLDALQEVGFNRASLGVQDFSVTVQQAINRLQSEELTRRVFDGLRARNFESINLDLIYGLPFQTVASFEATLQRILDISPDRLAVFNYAHVPWMKKHQRVIDEKSLPNPATKLQILKSTIETLTSSGYVYIGMDHFAKPDDELTKAFYDKKLHRNFQGYSTRPGCDLYAFGMSSISQVDDVYAQNVKDIPTYFRALDAGELATEKGYRLDADDRIRRHVITRLMCDFELDKRAIEERFGLQFDDYFKDALAQLEPMVFDGLVEQTEDKLVVTREGALLIRNVAMAFDAHLRRMQKEKRAMFSKTI